MEEPKNPRDLATPPYFKSWSTIYWLVIGNLVLIIFLLYLFSISFR